QSLLGLKKSPSFHLQVTKAALRHLIGRFTVADMHTVMAVLLLTARFYSVADIAASDRATATHVTANILHDAGVEVVWMDCNDRVTAHKHTMSDGCSQPPGSNEVIVRFVSAPSSNRSGNRSASDSLGDAYIDTIAASGSLATVYVDRVAAMS